MVSGLMFKHLVHFELIFVYGVREWSSFILLHAAPFIEATVLSALYIRGSFVVN